MALYHKYRPESLDKIEGNIETVKALSTILNRENKDIPHAFLLTGPSGMGKTTIARIIAKALNCADCDFTEVDAADFKGIDTIREIRSHMSLKPMAGPVRVWLLDECHALSHAAMPALLKALEDTPKHVYFILATTDPQKLLPTIRNRCTAFEMRPLTDKRMFRLLRRISKAEGVNVPEAALNQIVSDSIGSARMALVILDKIIDLKPEDMEKAAKEQAALENEVIGLCRALMKCTEWKIIAGILKGLSADPESIRRMVLGYCQSCLLKGIKDAYIVMDCFREPTYNIGMPGIVMSCWEAIQEDE